MGLACLVLRLFVCVRAQVCALLCVCVLVCLGVCVCRCQSLLKHGDLGVRGPLFVEGLGQPPRTGCRFAVQATVEHDPGTHITQVFW